MHVHFGRVSHVSQTLVLCFARGLNPVPVAALYQLWTIQILCGVELGRKIPTVNIGVGSVEIFNSDM